MNANDSRPDRPQREDAALAEALAAVARGWRVLPIVAGGKVPVKGFRWTRDAAGDAEAVRELATRHAGCNWGVSCGASGLVVLDVDGPAGEALLAELARHDGPLPLTAEATTGRKHGWHVYFRQADGRRVGCPKPTGWAGKLDVKGDGGYVVLPGSAHASGRRYRWADGQPPEDAGLAEVPVWLLDLLDPAADGHATQDTHATHGMRMHVSGDAAAVLADADVRPRVDVAVRATLPTRPGTRNRQLFELARRLKAVPELADLPAAALRGVVLDWHRRALENVRTKAADVSVADFAHAWHNARSGRGDALTAAVEAAAVADDPPGAVARGYGDGLRFVVRLCRELQRRRPGLAFMLSCRVLADAMKQAGHPTNYDDAAALLRLLVAEGVLVLDKPADKGKRRAAEYRYLLDDAEGGAA